MSAKPLNRQPSRRIVPAIPLALARRAKVSRPDSKSDQPAQDQGKSAPQPAVHDTAEAYQNGIEQAATPVEQTTIEPSEKNTTKPSEAKQALAERSETNGILEKSAQAAPFVAQHRPRQSESLVFGGLQESSSASPAAPSTMFASPAPVPQVPRQFTPQENLYPAPQMPAAPFTAAPQVNGHAPPPTNGIRGGHINGMSPSPSQASSMVPGDSGVGTPDAQATLKQHMPAPSLHMPPGLPIDTNVKHLLDFLLAQFGRSEFADYMLELSGGSASKPMLPLHSMLLARYPHILSILHSLPSRRDSYSGALVVHFPQAYYFQSPDALADALRYIYGSPLIDPATLLQSFPPVTTTIEEHRINLDSRMRYALSYLATGHCLDIPDIAMHGYRIVSNLMTWETLGALLSFAVAGTTDDGNSHPTYGMYASQLLQQIVNFLGINMPSDFVLDTSVLQLASLPRLPHSRTPSPEHRPRPDSRHSLFATSDAPPAQRKPGIRFGQAPPTDSDASFPAQTLSAVLLSLPFFLLKVVLEHYVLADRMGLEGVQLLAGDVVRERERRRREVLDSLPDKSVADQVLLGEESVVVDDRGCGIRVYRSRVTF